MAAGKHTKPGRNGTQTGEAGSNGSGKATLESRLNRLMKVQEARGAYRDFPHPSQAVDELRSRAKAA